MFRVHSAHNDRMNRKVYGIQKGNAGAQRNERIHIRHAFQERRSTVFEETEIDGDRRCRKHELQYVIHRGGRQRQREHTAHGKIHNRNKQDKRNKKPLFQHFRFAFPAFFFSFPVFADPVPQSGDGRKNIFFCHDLFVVFHTEAFPQQGNFRIFYAVQFFRNALHARRTCRTTHPGDGESFFRHMPISPFRFFPFCFVPLPIIALSLRTRRRNALFSQFARIILPSW